MRKTLTILNHWGPALLLIFLISFTSCVMEDEPTPTETVEKIVVSKKEVLKEGTTKFIMSFKDLSSEYVDFGIYSNYELGDTICFECEEGKSFNNWNCYVPDPNKDQ